MFILIRQLLVFLFIVIGSTSFADDYKKGFIVLEEGDYKTAIYFMTYFANLGDHKAQYNYEIMLKRGLGIKKNVIEAFYWFLESANQGNILSNYMVGNMYYKGEGINQNYKLAYDHIKFLLFLVMHLQK